VREFIVDHKVKKWGTRPRRWRETARTLGLAYPPNSDPATMSARWASRAFLALGDGTAGVAMRACGRCTRLSRGFLDG
jgi:hypothetical protein